MSGLAAYLAANYGDGGEGVHVKAPAGAEVSSAEGVGERPKAKKLKKAPQDGARKRRKKIKGTKIAVRQPTGIVVHDDEIDYMPPPAADEHVFSGARDSAPGVSLGDLVRQEEKERLEGEKEARDSGKFRAIGASSAPQLAERHDSPDQSPPRRARHDSPDQSPPRRARHDSPDQSPPRRGRHDSPDQSPPRRGRQGSRSPPRRGRAQGSSPPRRGRSPVTGHSPPRRGRATLSSAGTGRDLSPPRRNVPRDLSPPRRPPANFGGVHTAADIKAENVVKQQRKAELLASMSAADSGVGAETVHRDSQGRRIDPKLERLRQREEQKKKDEEAEKNMRWGRGLAQQDEREERAKEEARVMAAPFARHKDDDGLNEMLKKQIHAEDPMAAYMLEQRRNTGNLSGGKARPVYRGPPPPPNRFKIPPGHRWDGRDRSNGWEAKRFAFQAKRRATASAAYKWSSESL